MFIVSWLSKKRKDMGGLVVKGFFGFQRKARSALTRQSIMAKGPDEGRDTQGAAAAVVGACAVSVSGE